MDRNSLIDGKLFVKLVVFCCVVVRRATRWRHTIDSI